MTALKKPTNERLETVQMSKTAACISEIAAKRLVELLGEIEEKLKVVEAKKTLHIRLTQEERAVWILFGKKN